MYMPEVLKRFESIRFKVRGLPLKKATVVLKEELGKICSYYEVSPEYVVQTYLRWKKTHKSEQTHLNL